VSQPISDYLKARTRIDDLVRQHRSHPVLTTQIRTIAHEGPLHLQTCRVLRLNTGAEDVRARVEYADGGRYTAILVPRFSDGRLQLLLRYRPAIGRWSLELPRSTAPDDDSGWRASAETELLHSTGLTCPQMQLLGSVNIDPCFLRATALVILASDCRVGQSPTWDEQRLIAGAVTAPAETLPELIRNGEIECGHTLAALSIYSASQRVKGM
jgi:hypothetical protein